MSLSDSSGVDTDGTVVGMEPIADILARVCPCGGDPSGPSHEESLLHRQWLLGKALSNHDPLEDTDRRKVAAIIPPSENYRHELG